MPLKISALFSAGRNFACVVGLLGVLLLASCGGGAKHPRTAAAPASAAGYPAHVQSAFLRSCRSFGGNDQVCHCALRKAEAAIPLPQWAVDELKLVYGSTTERITSPLGHDITLCAGQQAEEAG
jgi:hypothetical protein